MNDFAADVAQLVDFARALVGYPPLRRERIVINGHHIEIVETR